MSSKCRGSEACYNAGCRSDVCKRAAAAGRREGRRREREAVGEFDAVDRVRRSLVSIPDCGPSASDFADSGVSTRAKPGQVPLTGAYSGSKFSLAAMSASFNCPM